MKWEQIRKGHELRLRVKKEYGWKTDEIVVLVDSFFRGTLSSAPGIKVRILYPDRYATPKGPALNAIMKYEVIKVRREPASFIADLIGIGPLAAAARRKPQSKQEESQPA